MPPGASAITFGPLVIVRSRVARAGGPAFERLMRHELVHVRQWRELGVLRFLSQYLGAYFELRLRGHSHFEAYRRIPLEIEAEQLS